MLNAKKIKAILARQYNSKFLDCDTMIDPLLHCIAYGYNNYSHLSWNEHNIKDQFEFKVISLAHI